MRDYSVHVMHIAVGILLVIVVYNLSLAHLLRTLALVHFDQDYANPVRLADKNCFDLLTGESF